jgi:phage terminase large subunit GpA-like protein
LAFEESDKRRFHVRCPHCDKEQILKWHQVRWSGSDHDSAQYHCALCGAAWTDAQRWVAVRHGRWIAGAPFKGIAGFHINELYSPWRKISQIVNAFLESKDSPARRLTLSTFRPARCSPKFSATPESPWTQGTL